MKKFFLPTLLVLSSFAVFAQEDQEEHSAAYEFGRKNAIPILIGVIILIVLIIGWIRSRKKKNEPPQQTG
jgi:LPXTG-motif cell wall-anchored protein